MPEPLRPTPAKVFVRTNWIYIPTIASAALAPTVAEATAASALDVTGMAFNDTGPNPTLNSSPVNQARRLGDGAIYQFPGVTTYEGGICTLQMNPQAAAASDAVKAWEKFTEGLTGFFARRLNVAKATNVTAGQFLDVFPMEVGGRLPGAYGDGEAAEASFSFLWTVSGPPAFKVAVLI